MSITTFDINLYFRNLTEALLCVILFGGDEMERSAVIELSAFNTTSKSTKRISVKGRDFYSLSYRYHGKVLIKTAESEFISDEDTVTFMPKSISYETEIIEETRMVAIHFKLHNDIKFSNPVAIKIHSKEIPSLFEKLIESSRADSQVSFEGMSVFYELLAQLEKLCASEQEKNIPKKIVLAREKMLQCFSDPLFSISSLAESLRISTSYLRREFSIAYGKSPISFLRELRLDRAKKLLESEYLTIGQISEQSGFSSPSYFIQVFHRSMGCSPEKYRKG